MRTIFLILASISIAISSSFANNITTANVAEKTMSVVATTSNNKAINLQLKNIMAERFTVRIKNINGEVFYFEKVKDTHQYMKRFTLTALPDGNYYFEIEMPQVDGIHKPFFIKDGVVNIPAIGVDYLSYASANLVNFEVKSIVANAIDIQLDNATAKACKIRIKNATGDVVYFEKLCKESALAKRYILDEMPAGDYLVEIETKDGKLVKRFSLQGGIITWKSDNAVAKA